MLKKMMVFTVLLLLAVPVSAAQQEPQAMKVHFIDVGQGDSTLIETPGGKTVLIDGGMPKGGEKVRAYLKQAGIKRIDLLIASHPDMDHIGGLLPILNEIKIGRILDSGKLHSTMIYQRYLELIRKKGIPFEIAVQDDFIQVDPSITLQVLNAYDRDKENNNEASIVLKLSYKKTSFLLMADAEIEQEKGMLKQYDLEADILKVGHHGSKTSTSFGFLQAVQPKAAILTYHKYNRFGHPVSRVVRNLWRVDADIYSTAVFGDIVVQTNGDYFFIMPTKSPLDQLTRKKTGS